MKILALSIICKPLLLHQNHV